MAKQFGLIIPKPGPAKVAVTGIKKFNVFGDDSESDEESSKPRPLIGPGVNQKRQARVAQEKALAEDPNVYKYDEVYDDMEEKKAELKKKDKSIKKEPKYIEKLLENADKRKKEHERRLERQIQKERQAEGDEFAGKEEFVTSSYRKKLEEMKKLEAEEKREEYLEEIGDVRKQRDLGGFYRHLYEQQLGSDKKKDIDVKGTETPNLSLQEPEKDKGEKIKKAKRVYRKRSLTEDVEEEKTDGKATRAHIQSNIDADSDFSIDSSSDSEDDEAKGTKDTNTETEVVEKNNDIDQVVVKQEPEVSDKQQQWNDGFKIPEKMTKLDDIAKVKEEDQKNKIDIWKKRTVGDVLQGAIERYYIRKAQRSARA